MTQCNIIPYISIGFYLSIINSKYPSMIIYKYNYFVNYVSYRFFFIFRSEVFDMRPKSEPLISSRTHYWEIPPDVFGILTPSATSTILTGIGIALKLSFTTTKVEEDYEGRSMFHSTSFRKKFNSMN